MELDELKKSWNVLNEQLQKEPVTDEKQLTALIASYKKSAHGSLMRLTILQRLSLGIGALGLIILLLIWLLMPTFGFNEHTQMKIAALLAFIAVSIMAGLWWDWKTFRWSKSIRVDEMSVADVSLRTTTLRRWTGYEVIAISLWVVIFNSLYYWIMEYHLAPIAVQAVFITCIVLVDTLVIYFFYKKMVYKHLNNIKKNIEELKDICTE